MINNPISFKISATNPSRVPSPVDGSSMTVPFPIVVLVSIDPSSEMLVKLWGNQYLQR